MIGKTTAVVLGAGASYCYGGSTSGIPIQQNIVGKLFAAYDTSGLFHVKLLYTRGHEKRALRIDRI